MPTRSGTALACVGVVVMSSIVGQASGQVRVLNYNVAKLAGSTSSLTTVLAGAHADDTLGFAHPVDIFLFQEVTNSSISGLTTIVNNAAPAGTTYALATYTTSGNEDSAAGAQACFYRTQTISEVTSGHVDIATGGSRNSDRWLLKLVGYDSPAASLYVYSSHLKASTGFEAERLAGAQALRNNADALGAGVRCLFVGDYNVYNNSEPAYIEMLSPGNSQGVDPLGTANWTGATNAWKHTQSPRLPSGTLVGGGMDDRFDLHIPSIAMSDGTGIAIIPGSLRSLGNDGNHFDMSINTGSNTFYPGQLARSNALATALFEASDHIPVMCDYQVPGQMAASLGAVTPRVIIGSSATVGITVSNTVSVAAAICSDVVAFTAVGTGSLLGTTSDTAPLAPSSASAQVTMVASSVGAKTGSVVVSSSSEGVQNANITLPANFSVVSHSNGSFAPTQDADTRTINWEVSQGTSLATIDVPVYNFGAGALQALLDLDSSTYVSGVALSVQSGLVQGIGTTPATVRFALNAASMGPGTYTSIMRLNASDENLPGANVQSLTATFNITVLGAGVVGDLNGDGLVNGVDLAVLLGNWGGTGATDLTGDGVTNGADLAIVLGAWS